MLPRARSLALLPRLPARNAGTTAITPPQNTHTIATQTAGIIFFAETLNAAAADHWEAFAAQNYFDARGVFFSALVSGPLLLVLFAVLVGALCCAVLCCAC